LVSSEEDRCSTSKGNAAAALTTGEPSRQIREQAFYLRICAVVGCNLIRVRWEEEEEEEEERKEVAGEEGL
jgi:hypothetical protein